MSLFVIRVGGFFALTGNPAVKPIGGMSIRITLCVEMKIDQQEEKYVEE
ncbi:MAG: hypothetical protein IPG87_15330 [Saprospiraceae bacterium]|nr:hypothetical protein [Candidatus Vicinibacter affinis]